MRMELWINEQHFFKVTMFCYVTYFNYSDASIPICLRNFLLLSIIYLENISSDFYNVKYITTLT